MGGGEGAKGNLKNEDVDQTGGLEPDPRYIRCCSAVCRPGYALRDALLGLLVLLGLSVVVTVIFVVCFYVVPDEKQLIDDGILPGNAEGVIRGPEPEDINEITLRDGDKYTLPPHELDEHSLDFSTLATSSGNLHEPTEQNILSEKSDNEPSDVFTTSEDEELGNQDGPPLEARENFEDILPEEHNVLHGAEQEVQESNQFTENRRPDRHNLGHIDERLELSNEHGHFHRDEDIDTTDTKVLEDNTTEESKHVVQQQQECSPVQLPMCVSSVPWSLAHLPNWLNHTSEGEMFAALPYVRSSLLDSGCSSLAPLYACSVLEPPCTETGVLPPCRAFCAEVARSCQSFVQRPTLPGLFDCNRFPDSTDPDVCVSAQQGPSRHHSGRPLSLRLNEDINATPVVDFTTTTQQSDTEHFTVNTGISFSTNSENLIANTFTSVIPHSKRSPTNNFEEFEASTHFTPTTVMSLADRLKVALAKSKTRAPPTERIQRHSKYADLHSSTTVASDQNKEQTGFSLADRFSLVTTSKTKKFQTTRQPIQVEIVQEVIERAPARARQQTLRDRLQSKTDETDKAKPVGVMSLAELLALSNKAKPLPKPATRRANARRRPLSNFDRFNDQISEASIATTQIIDSTSSRLRFRGHATTNNRDIDFRNDKDRIPVRSVDEIPPPSFKFRMLNRSRPPVTFRTTAEAELTTTEVSPSATETTMSAVLSKFVPSSSLKNRKSIRQSTDVLSTSTTSPTESSITSCPELQCLDGKCIKINQLNDGVIDCSDGSDEHDFGSLVS